MSDENDIIQRQRYVRDLLGKGRAGAPASAGQTTQFVIGAAVVLGTLALLNLGRSFGILVAVRKIKTDWLYSVVRHPMYLTDIVWKIGMLLFLPYWLNAVVMVFAVGCYVWRAIIEERFLCQFPEYRQYMQKVRYRFIPGIF